MKIYESFFKRPSDFVAALLLLVLLSPVLVVTALLVWLESGRPVFFRQRRVGRHLNVFFIFKFRSMVVNAPALGGYSTAFNDPRITKMGKFIRKTSLDELPQIVNVITGDMSLVGPRPDVPEQVEHYASQATWIKRHTVRPGITGLAQVEGRSSLTMAKREAFDLQYVEEVSFFGDLRILFKTATSLFAKGRAN